MSKISFLARCFYVGAFTLIASTAATAQTRYTVLDLTATLPAGSAAYPTAINDAGQVTGGFLDSSGNLRGFYFDGVLSKDIEPNYLGKDVWSTGISSSGKVIGSIFASGALGISDAFIWADGKGLKTASSPGQKESEGLAISKNGRELYLRDAACQGGSARQLVTRYKNEHVAVPSTGGCAHFNSFASVNNLGWVAGTEYAYGAVHAVLFDGTQTIDLHDRLGFSGTYSYVNDMNDKGDVVGWVETVMVYMYNAVSGELKTFDLGHWFESINNKGVAVGHQDIYTTKEGFRNINSLLAQEANGWVIQNLKDINDRGQIVGTAVRKENMSEERAVVLTPQVLKSK